MGRCTWMSMIPTTICINRTASGAPTEDLSCIRWAKSVGLGRWRTANGGRSACPVKRNGRKRHAARMVASIPGAMTRRSQTLPSLAAPVARRCPSGSTPRGPARMACWTWRGKRGSGRPPSTSLILTTRRMAGKTSPWRRRASPGAVAPPAHRRD